MGDTRGGPVRLRAEGEETDQDNDEQTSVDHEGENWQRAVPGGELNWSADAERSDRAPKSNMPEQQGEVARHRGQKRRTQ